MLIIQVNILKNAATCGRSDSVWWRYLNEDKTWCWFGIYFAFYFAASVSPYLHFVDDIHSTVVVASCVILLLLKGTEEDPATEKHFGGFRGFELRASIGFHLARGGERGLEWGRRGGSEKTMLGSVCPSSSFVMFITLFIFLLRLCSCQVLTLKGYQQLLP